MTNLILQDLENTLAFTEWNILHSPIKKMRNLYQECMIMKNQLRPGELFFPATLENFLKEL